VTPELTTVQLTDAHNFSFEVTVDIAAFSVAELTDVQIDWSAVDQDFFGQPLNPAEDVNTVWLKPYTYKTHEEVEGCFVAPCGSWQPEAELLLSAETTGQTSVGLGDLGLFGTDLDIETFFSTDYARSWLVWLSTGDTCGLGMRMAAFLDPVPEEGSTEAYLDAQSTVFHFDADLRSMERLPVPTYTPFTVSWSDLTEDGRGRELRPGDVVQIQIARYDSLALSHLETHIQDLPGLANRTWSQHLDPGTSKVDLQHLEDEEGRPFPGIDPVGTWLLQLQDVQGCDPTPVFLAVLEPAGLEYGEDPEYYDEGQLMEPETEPEHLLPLL
jgi:hypothetical protein